MQEIKSNIVVFSYIIQTNKHEIEIDEILRYISDVKRRLKGTNYYIEKIDKEEIIKIASMYPSICNHSNSKIIVNDIEKSHGKISKFFLKDISQDVINYLTKGEKFVFPIIYNNKLILYQFNSTDKLLNEIKGQFYYDDLKSNGYIIDIDVLKEHIPNPIDHILTILLKSKMLNMHTFDYDELIEFKKYIEGLLNEKYKKYIEYFNMDSDINKVYSYHRIIGKYFNSANNNLQHLSLDKEKLKVLVAKIK